MVPECLSFLCDCLHPKTTEPRRCKKKGYEPVSEVSGNLTHVAVCRFMRCKLNLCSILPVSRFSKSLKKFNLVLIAIFINFAINFLFCSFSSWTNKAEASKSWWRNKFECRPSCRTTNARNSTLWNERSQRNQRISFSRKI